MPQVTITSNTVGAEIRYSTDNSDVTEQSTLYSGQFSVEAGTTVKAKAFKSGMNPSPQSTLQSLPKLQTPTISLSRSGSTINITIGNTVSGATYRYKVGSAPTSASDGTAITSTGSVNNSAAVTIYVAGWYTGQYNPSDSASDSVAQYTPTLQTPTLSLSRNGSTVTGAIGNTVSDATYVYKVGSAPSSQSDGTVISGTSFSFTNDNAVTVYVRGYKSGYNPSSAVSDSVNSNAIQVSSVNGSILDFIPKTRDENYCYVANYTGSVYRLSGANSQSLITLDNDETPIAVDSQYIYVPEYNAIKVYNKSSGSFVKDITYERNTDYSNVEGASSSAYYKLVFCTRNCIYVLNNDDTVSQYINDDVRNVFPMNDGKIFIQHYDELNLHSSPSSVSSYSISASMNNTIGVERNNKIFTYDKNSGKSCFVDSSGNKTLITSSYFDSNSDRDNVCSDGYRIYTIGSNNTLVILESNGTEKTKQFTPIANTQSYRAIVSNENYLYVSGYNSSTTRYELIVLSNLR